MGMELVFGGLNDHLQIVRFVSRFISDRWSAKCCVHNLATGASEGGIGGSELSAVTYTAMCRLS